MAMPASVHSAHDELDIIKRYMIKPPETSVVMTIMPAMASAILAAYNTENRSLKPRKIRAIVGALRNEEWLVTGETIKFSSTRLLDGQNRLTACVESHTPIRTHVVFGIPDAAFAIIDTGAPRTPGDVLYIAGIHDPHTIAHIVRWMYTLESAPGLRSRLDLSPNSILHLYRTRYSDITDHLGWGRQLQTASGSRVPIARGALLHYAFERFGGRDRADEFLQSWIDGPEKRARGIPQAFLLRRRLMQMSDYTSGLLPVTLSYATVVKAWNAYIRGAQIGVADLKWGPEEPFPSVLPRPKIASE